MPIEALIEKAAELEASQQSIDILTAGEILERERKRLGLNEKEVADQLHVTKHYVKALESNSYEKLPGAVFVKGYLKSYALFLGLDVEDLMSRYDEFADQQDADSAEERRLLGAHKKKVRDQALVIVSLLLFVVGFLGLWLANSYFTEESIPDLPSPAESVEGGENIRPALSQVVELQVKTQLTWEVELEEISAPTSQSVTSPALEELSVLASEQLVELDLGSKVDSVSAQSAETSGSGGSSSVEELTSVLQTLRAEQTALAEATESRVFTIESIGNDVLRISFIGESWIEVNDSESQQIYRDIREAGDVLEIIGSAPFNILLGDAPFINMSLNGDEIDLSADIRIDNSARLTVGL